jgi:hypothetical protein
VDVSAPAPQTSQSVKKASRPLILTLMRRYTLSIIHLDAFGELLPDFITFDW